MGHANITAVSDASFAADVLGADRPVLVKFQAEWCAPCKAMEPAIEEIAGEYADRLAVVTLDIDANNQTPYKYGVRGVPTVMLFDKGQVVGQRVGLARKADLNALVQQGLR
ncbi:MAG TPA: thioredoxin [Povalibacter sp.]|nr:thioredoxin [Povalibacter sp.]